MNQGMTTDISQVMAIALASGLFVSVFTARAPDGTISGGGTPSGTYTDVPGLTLIQCMDAPDITQQVKVGAFQRRNESEVASEADRHVLLDGYYPTLQAGWRAGWQAIVDGVSYNIFGVESDSQRIMTRVKLQAVSV